MVVPSAAPVASLASSARASSPKGSRPNASPPTVNSTEARGVTGTPSLRSSWWYRSPLVR